MQKPAEGGGGRGREAESGHPRDRTGRGAANKRRTGVESGAGYIKGERGCTLFSKNVEETGACHQVLGNWQLQEPGFQSMRAPSPDPWGGAMYQDELSGTSMGLGVRVM